MTKQEIQELKDHQIWRKGGDSKMIEPSRLTYLMDKIISEDQVKSERIKELEEALKKCNHHLANILIAEVYNSIYESKVKSQIESNKKLLKNT